MSSRSFFFFDEEVMVLGIVGVEIGLRAVDRDLPQQPDFGELVQRVVDGGKRHRHFGAVRFLVQHFRRDVPVALGEQDPAERHALPGRAQADFAQLRLHVVPGAAGEIVSPGRRTRLDRRGCCRHAGGGQEGTRGKPRLVHSGT